MKCIKYILILLLFAPFDESTAQTTAPDAETEPTLSPGTFCVRKKILIDARTGTFTMDTVFAHYSANDFYDNDLAGSKASGRYDTTPHLATDSSLYCSIDNQSTPMTVKNGKYEYFMLRNNGTAMYFTSSQKPEVVATFTDKHWRKINSFEGNWQKLGPVYRLFFSVQTNGRSSTNLQFEGSCSESGVFVTNRELNGETTENQVQYKLYPKE